MKFNVKLVVVIMIVLAIIAGSTLTVALINSANTIQNLTVSRAETANRTLTNAIADYQANALEMSKATAGFADVIEAIESGDGAKLQQVLASHEGSLDFITVTDGSGIVIARSYSDKRGDDITNQKVISTAISTGNGISAIEPGTQIPLAIRASTVIKDDAGKIIAVLSCGYDLSNPVHLDKIKEQSDCQVTIFAGDTRLSTTITNEKGERVIGTQAAANVVETVIQNRGTYQGKVTLFGTQYQVCYTPLIVDGNVLGMLFSGVNIEDTAARERDMTILIAVAAFILILEVIIVVLVIRWTLRKVFWYESLLDSIPSPISVTDMNMKWTFINKPVEQMLSVKRSDMIGKHCSSWGAAICNTENCGITCLKKGQAMTFFEQMGMDFKVDTSYIYDASGKHVGHIEIVSDISDLMKTQKAQSGMVSEISQISRSFVLGSQQIADGAQALSQGSTEQAAVVEELSASISAISQKTVDNAQMAGRAADLANSIKENAEKGNSQMNQMISAVKEINEASQSVNRVIKVIDDIAFQTNILALNAAVEAARAGQHGKGFAVVAEEVRNLASKSAEAAKDTGGLIANSMEKAELGAKIAGETAASFEDIVSGINESNQIVESIANSSNEQSRAISEINTAIDQVAQVVQQNSATAEESAAASQELSGQSAVLDDIISRFERENNLKVETATGFSIDS